MSNTTTQTKSATIAALTHMKELNAKQKAASKGALPIEQVIENLERSGFTVEQELVENKKSLTLKDGVAIPFVKHGVRVHIYYGHNNVGIFTSSPLKSIPYYASKSKKLDDGTAAPIPNQYGAVRSYCNFQTFTEKVMPELIKMAEVKPTKPEPKTKAKPKAESKETSPSK